MKARDSKIAPHNTVVKRVSWEDDGAGGGTIIGEWDGQRWSFSERDPWEIRWFALTATPGLVAKAERLAWGRRWRRRTSRSRKVSLAIVPTTRVRTMPRGSQTVMAAHHRFARCAGSIRVEIGLQRPSAD